MVAKETACGSSGPGSGWNCASFSSLSAAASPISPRGRAKLRFAALFRQRDDAEYGAVRVDQGATRAAAADCGVRRVIGRFVDLDAGGQPPPPLLKKRLARLGSSPMPPG